MKKVLLPVCITGALLVAALATWLLLPQWFAPHYSASSDVSLPIHGDINRTADIESQLCEAIIAFEDNTENLALTNTYQKDDTMRFTFSFDRTAKGYPKLWADITKNELTGVADLTVSIPDATVRYISYNYGYIQT